MDEPSPALSDVQKIAGGVEIEVAFEDGRTERVKVRQLKMIKEFDRYLAVQNNEAAEIELVCDKPKGWTETLTPESFDALADKSQELNLPFFQKRYRRLIARSEAMNPGFLQKATSAARARLENESPDAVSGSPS